MAQKKLLFTQKKHAQTGYKLSDLSYPIKGDVPQFGYQNGGLFERSFSYLVRKKNRHRRVEVCVVPSCSHCVDLETKLSLYEMKNTIFCIYLAFWCKMEYGIDMLVDFLTSRPAVDNKVDRP